jgi:hypothetical protein
VRRASHWSDGFGDKFKSYPSAIAEFLLNMIIHWTARFKIV